MITAQNKNDYLQIEIADDNVSPSLPKTSFVRCHRIATIESNLILGVISKANDNLLELVEKKIQNLIQDSNTQIVNVMVGGNIIL